MRALGLIASFVVAIAPTGCLKFSGTSGANWPSRQHKGPPARKAIAADQGEPEKDAIPSHCDLAHCSGVSWWRSPLTLDRVRYLKERSISSSC